MIIPLATIKRLTGASRSGDLSYLSVRVFQVRDRSGDSMVIFENPDPFEPFLRRMSRFKRAVEAFRVIAAVVITAQLSDDTNILNHDLAGIFRRIPEIFLQRFDNAPLPAHIDSTALVLS